mmetsp:Transcript_41016/g.53765  ORF Transcript_41016/g.53765 Transcript_41016/m.53765 type:complete len:92 (+) Transcript_41016:99-374(+)
MVVVADQSQIGQTIFLYAIVLLLGAMAGGHFNPATSVGVYTSGGSKSFRCLINVTASQISGAITGAGLAFAFLSEYDEQSSSCKLAENKVP